MFDQKSMPDETKQPNRSVEPPVNLPIGSPVPPANEPEDILADIDSSSPSIALPSQPARLEPLLPATPAKPKTETREPFFKRHQKIFIILLIGLAAVAVLAAGGWYAYSQFFAPENAALINSDQLNLGLDADSVNQGTNQPVNVNSDLVNQPDDFIPTDTTVQPSVPIDTDRDGVTDDEEAVYGTDPTKVDTDDDGLTDRDETKVFRTDPNNPDTDGDGYTDGAEVRAGYDPKGPGRLLKIE